MPVAVALAGGGAPGVPAQEAAREEGLAAVEEVLVTGSRLTSGNLLSSSPLLSVSEEEIAFRGTVRMEELLSTVPAVFIDQHSSLQNGATGTATVELRNLSPERTLVLVNGRRLPAGSPIDGGAGADINQIPAALIRKVEVLTGGVSAVYGSDAMAGVINFMLKDDFEGLQLGYQFSQYQHDNDNGKYQRIVRAAGFEAADGTVEDGAVDQLSVVVGGNLEGGRGNVSAYATWRNIRAVKQSERDYSSCALDVALAACGGAATIPSGAFISPTLDFTVVGDEFVPREGLLYNYQEASYYQRPDERITLGSFAHYQLNEYVDFYTELMFMDDSSLTQQAPSGAFFETNEIQCANPLLSAQQFKVLCEDQGLGMEDTAPVRIGRRNVEGNPRQDDLRHTSYRGVFGARGEFQGQWRYDVFYQYAEVSMERTFLNDVSITRVARALDAVAHPDSGEILCRAALEGFDTNCVPWNVFTEGGVSQEALDYIALPLFARGNTSQRVLTAYLSGGLGEYGVRVPFAESGVDVVFGVEQRRESLRYNPDQGYRTGDGAGQGGAQQAVRGAVEVTEFFVEADVPVLEARPYAEHWTLNLGYRYSDYDYDVHANTFGIRSDWQINSDFRVRGSFQRALRGPNVRELFDPAGFNLFEMDRDPCAGAVTDGKTEAGRSLEECVRSGVTEEQFGAILNSPAKQYNFLDGGNADLDPEDGDTWSLGIIYTPTFLEDFSISLDYFSIKIEQGISSLTPAFILNECLDGDLAQCALVNRGEDGDLWVGSDVSSSGHIVSLQENLALEEVAGVDLVVDYVQRLEEWGLAGWGRLEFDNVLSYIHKWDQQELERAPVVDCKGNWGGVCGYPTPQLRNQLRLSWRPPWPLRLSVAWRYVAKVEDLNAAAIDLGARHYFDVAGIWETDGGLSIRAGVNNVLDKDPPIAGQAAGPSENGEGNVFPGIYDVLGRYLFLALSLEF